MAPPLLPRWRRGGIHLPCRASSSSSITASSSSYLPCLHPRPRPHRRAGESSSSTTVASFMPTSQPLSSGLDHQGQGWIGSTSYNLSKSRKRKIQPMLMIPHSICFGKFCSRILASKRHQVKTTYVKNLPENASKEKIKELFDKHGEVTKVVLPPAKAGHKRDFGFVHFAERLSALKAVKGSEKYDIDGQVLEVSMAKPLADKKPDHSHRPGGGPNYPFPPYGGGYMGDPYGAYGGGVLHTTRSTNLNKHSDVQNTYLQDCNVSFHFINTILLEANDIW